MNLGVEFELLKGKLNGGVELFYRKTTDMLNWFNVPLSLVILGTMIISAIWRIRVLNWN